MASGDGGGGRGVLRRPQPSDTEDDLFEFQRKFIAQKERQEWTRKLEATQRPSATVIRHKNLNESTEFPLSTRSTLSTVVEDVPPGVLSDVRERVVAAEGACVFEWRGRVDSAAAGFPDVDDLADALLGADVAACRAAAAAAAPLGGDALAALKREVADENAQKLQQMAEEDILRQRQHLLQSLDPKLVEFIRKSKSLESQRVATALEEQQAPSTKESELDPRFEQEAFGSSVDVDELVKNLEVINSGRAGASKTPDDADADIRLASDPLNVDLLSKCSAAMRQRKERNVVCLFFAHDDEPDAEQEVQRMRTYHIEEVRRSALTASLDTLLSDEQLLTIARQNLFHIRRVYLNKSDDRDEAHFKRGISPVLDPIWLLEPTHQIYSKYAAVNQTRSIADVDLNALTHSLLWVVYLLHIKPTFFYVTMNFAGIYCRLMEIFFLGSEVFLDSLIFNCLAALLRRLLIPQLEKGTLQFPLNKPIAERQSFLDFYKLALVKFDQESFGDALFAHFLLLPTLSVDSDAQLKSALWTLDHTQGSVLRHLTLHTHTSWFAGTRRFEQRLDETDERVLLAYAAALSSGAVTSRRNGLLFDTAVGAIRRFVRVDRRADRAALRAALTRALPPDV